MLTIHFADDNFRNLRLTFSPMWELVMSYRLLKQNRDNDYLVPAAYRAWYEAAQHDLYGFETPLLDFYSSLRASVPGVLLPRRQAEPRSIAEELQHLLELPHEKLRQSAHYVMEQNPELAQAPVYAFLLHHTDEAVQQLLCELDGYWERALSRHWLRIQSVLEGDLLYRGRQLVTGGAPALLRDIDTRVVGFENNILRVYTEKEMNISFYGGATMLMPSFFANHLWISPNAPNCEEVPLLTYTARGVGSIRQQGAETARALELTLGEARARILQQLMTPVNTGEIAKRLDITPGAVSQHLAQLRDAGLVGSHRNGRWVYYHLTPRGEQLLEVFAV